VGRPRPSQQRTQRPGSTGRANVQPDHDASSPASSLVCCARLACVTRHAVIAATKRAPGAGSFRASTAADVATGRHRRGGGPNAMMHGHGGGWPEPSDHRGGGTEAAAYPRAASGERPPAARPVQPTSAHACVQAMFVCACHLALCRHSGGPAARHSQTALSVAANGVRALVGTRADGAHLSAPNPLRYHASPVDGISDHVLGTSLTRCSCACQPLERCWRCAKAMRVSFACARASSIGCDGTPLCWLFSCCHNQTEL